MNTPMAARRGRARRWRFEAAMALVAAAACGYVVIAGAQTHQRDTAAAAAVHTDDREPVKFPAPMRLHIITSMRDHLLALQEIDVALRQMAPMARVTQPSGLSMQPISNSTKVRRERGGTTTRSKEIRFESSAQTEADRDMRGSPRSNMGSHWSPRCSLQNQPRASSAATSQSERHVKSFVHS